MPHDPFMPILAINSIHCLHKVQVLVQETAEFQEGTCSWVTVVPQTVHMAQRSPESLSCFECNRLL